MYKSVHVRSDIIMYYVVADAIFVRVIFYGISKTGRKTRVDLILRSCSEWWQPPPQYSRIQNVSFFLGNVIESDATRMLIEKKLNSSSWWTYVLKLCTTKLLEHYSSRLRSIMFSNSVSISILFRRWNNNILPHQDIADITININYFFVLDVNVGFETWDLWV